MGGCLSFLRNKLPPRAETYLREDLLFRFGRKSENMLQNISARGGSIFMREFAFPPGAEPCGEMNSCFRPGGSLYKKKCVSQIKSRSAFFYCLLITVD